MPNLIGAPTEAKVRTSGAGGCVWIVINYQSFGRDLSEGMWVAFCLVLSILVQAFDGLVVLKHEIGCRFFNVSAACRHRAVTSSEVAAREISASGASCQPPKTSWTRHKTPRRRSPRDGSSRRCLPFRKDAQERSESSLRPVNINKSYDEYFG